MSKLTRTQQRELVILQGEGTDLETKFNNFKIRTDKKFEASAHELLEIKSFISRVEEFFDADRKKHHAAWKAVLADQNELLGPAKKAEAAIKKAQSDFLTMREERQERKREKILKGGAGRITKPPKVQGVNARDEWDFEIVNEDKIDRVFMEPNMSDIRAAVIAEGKEAEKSVGGIRVFKRKVISASRGR